MENSLRRRQTYAVPVTFVHGWISMRVKSEWEAKIPLAETFCFQNIPWPTRTKRMDEKEGGGNGPAYPQRPLPPLQPIFLSFAGTWPNFFSPFVFPDTLEFENYRPTRSLPIDFRWRHKRLFCFCRASKHAPRARPYRVKNDFVTRFPLRHSFSLPRGPTKG